MDRPSIGSDLRTGDIVRDGPAGVEVQKPGMSVTATLYGVDASYELTVETKEDGTIEVSACGADRVEEDPRAPAEVFRPRSFSNPVATASSSPGECADTLYHLFPYKWTSTYRWYFKSSTTPSGLSATNVANALIDGTHSITAVRNTCGMADNVPAMQQYLGSTSSGANMNTTSCLSPNGINSTDFVGGPSGILARTCTWVSGGVAYESDLRFNDSRFNWMPTATGTCGGRYVIRAVAAHERGHTYGLNHVAEGSHGRLTMSELSDGPCQEQEFWLGRGDVLGVRARYGV